MFGWLKRKKIAKLTSKVKSYIDQNYKGPSLKEVPYMSNLRFSINSDAYDAIKKKEEEREKSLSDTLVLNAYSDYLNTGSIDRFTALMDKRVNMSFVDMMLRHINEKGFKDSKVYKAAQIDRRLYSKIISDRNYKPAKDTCIALCYGMELTLKETNDMLSRAGYSLSHSSKRDLILEYFFVIHHYDLVEINAVLLEMEQKVLGR